MASLISNHQVTNSNSDRVRKKKKKKSSSSSSSSSSQRKDLENQSQNHMRWKSEKQQKIYSSKLLQALSQVQISPAASPSAPRRGRAVREAADKVLAVASRGRTRWSRAILTNRLKLKFRKQKRQRTTAAAAAAAAAAATGSSRSKKPRVSVLRLKGKNLPAMQRKVRVLGGLVPGCRKQPLPVILEEATDYIPALEMQIRAMSALAELLSGSASGAGSSSAPPPS